ncbi:hypothetical protein [Metabacillus sp. Hm71]|uniref:hypothetical protein n=1 Tax=Metabacillus sp. Hm71 TaxID=3450743 RepID=UPI003F4382D8
MSNVKQKMLVATSIAPNNIERQKMAINTWINLGFEVVSLNSQEEITKLSPFFPNIKFQVVTRNAQARFGKPYVYIHDFMQYFKKTDFKVCGIINSDIHIKGIDKGFLNFLYNESLDSLVYGHRVDVDNLSKLNGTQSSGIDYFFFDKKLANIYDDDGLCMGRPAWDWWMVVVPVSKNIKTKRLLNQIAFHKKHHQQWDQSLNDQLINSIVCQKYLKKLYPAYDMQKLRGKLNEIILNNNNYIIYHAK